LNSRGESSNYDVNNQTNQIDNFVFSGVSLTLLSAADSKGIAPAVVLTQRLATNFWAKQKRLADELKYNGRTYAAANAQWRQTRLLLQRMHTWAVRQYRRTATAAHSAAQGFMHALGLFIDKGLPQPRNFSATLHQARCRL